MYFSTGLFTVVISFSCLLLTKAEWNTKDYLRREHSLIKPYSGGSYGSVDLNGRWDVVGSTLLSNNYVRLTPDHQSRRGGLWNNIPNKVRDWELHVHFKVHGKGRDLFGDGFAIWYVKDRLQLGPVFGSKDNFQGLAIFLDTYSNHNGPHNHGHPYISAMVNNGSMSYDHDRDGTHTEIAGCESSFRNTKHESYVAIRYEKNRLTVSTDIEGKNAWKQCFSVDGVRLPTGYYYGSTAATGQLADNHDIISMKLYDVNIDGKANDEADLDKIVPSADIFTPPRDHVEDPSGGFMLSKISGWKLFAIIFVGLIGLGVCGMVAFVVITNRQESQRKRFY